MQKRSCASIYVGGKNPRCSKNNHKCTDCGACLIVRSWFWNVKPHNLIAILTFGCLIRDFGSGFCPYETHCYSPHSVSTRILKTRELFCCSQRRSAFQELFKTSRLRCQCGTFFSGQKLTEKSNSLSFVKRVGDSNYQKGK